MYNSLNVKIEKNVQKRDQFYWDRILVIIKK